MCRNRKNVKFNFHGKGLFVFSDPGGAKAVLAQAYELKDNLENLTIISDRIYSFYKDFNVNVIYPKESVTLILEHLKPDFLFTGTSYTSKIELDYIKVAKEYNIPTYSFIDHWTSIKERFNYNNYYIFPDFILVIDEKAKKIADSIINSSNIIIFGNPYYKYLKNWKPYLSKEQLFSLLKIKNKKLVIFALDPLSNVNGKIEFGFDEIEVIENISKILNNNDFNLNFIFKLHPNQNLEKIPKNLSNKIIIIDSNFDNNLLIFYSDLIIGFFSNFLIEANIMNKRILRYNVKYNDPISELNIGEIVDDFGFIEELKLLNGIK